MANDINLGVGRAVKAAVMHLADNGYKFANLGALEAMQDPALTPLRKAINPLTQPTDKNVVWVKKAGRDVEIPRVSVTYKPQRKGTAITERLRPTTGIEATGALSVNVDYDKHWQETWLGKISNELLEPAAQNYLQALIGGNLNMGRERGIDYQLANLGSEMYGAIVPTIFEPARNYILTTLIASIGKNKAYPTAATPTAAAPIVAAHGFDAAGNPKRDMISTIQNTILANKFQSKPILIGGLKWLQWHRDMVIYKTNQDGLDFVAAYATMPWAFYYDDAIDTLLGNNKAIMFDAAAVAFDSVAYHGPNGLVKTGRHDDTEYLTGSIRFTQFKGNEPGLSNIGGIMSHALDFRVTERNSANDLPELLITPSLSAGMYTRPLGFYTADNSDIMNAVTGVFGFEMTTAS